MIEQNEGKGILGGTWTGGDTLTVHAMMVNRLWPDEDLMYLDITSGSKSGKVTLPKADHGYYVKLPGTKRTTGSGYLKND